MKIHKQNNNAIVVSTTKYCAAAVIINGTPSSIPVGSVGKINPFINQLKGSSSITRIHL